MEGAPRNPVKSAKFMYNTIMPVTVPPPRKNEQIQPDALVKVIKNEPKDEALEKKGPVAPHRASLPKSIWWGIGGLVLLFAGGSVVSFYLVKTRVAASVSTNLGTLRSGVQDLQNLNPQAAQQKFSTLQGSLQDLSSGNVGSLINSLGFLFKGGSNAIGALSDVGNQLSLFTSEVNDAASSSYAFFTTGNGVPLVGDLSRMRDTLGTIDTESNELSSAASLMGGLSSAGGSDFYLSLKTEVENAKSALDVFLPWLSEPQPHHMLVLLQNPSELRAAGGFLGKLRGYHDCEWECDEY